MAFSNYKTIGTTIQEFQVAYMEASFVGEIAFAIPDYFRADLQFMMREGVVDNYELQLDCIPSQAAA